MAETVDPRRSGEEGRDNSGAEVPEASATAAAGAAGEPRTVLAIDGGGVRGIVPAMILREIEDRCGKPAHEIFDVVTGTSTGSVIALLSTKPDPYTGEQLVELYRERSKDFFQRTFLHRLRSLDGLLKPRYSAAGVERTMRSVMGDTTELSAALTEVIIPTYDLRASWPRVLFFSRRFARLRPDLNFYIWQVARAATAAPGYFPGYAITSVDGTRTYHPIDGGVYINNPVIEGLVHAMASQRDSRRLLVVSLGTGFVNQPIFPDEVHDWGLLRWALPLLDVMFEGQSDAADNQLKELLPAMRHFRKRFRLQPQLPHPVALDDTRPEAIALLERVTAEYLDGRKARLTQLCRELMSR